MAPAALSVGRKDALEVTARIQSNGMQMNSGSFCLAEALKAQSLVAVWGEAVRTLRCAGAFY